MSRRFTDSSLGVGGCFSTEVVYLPDEDSMIKSCCSASSISSDLKLFKFLLSLLDASHSREAASVLWLMVRDVSFMVVMSWLKFMVYSPVGSYWIRSSSVKIYVETSPVLLHWTFTWKNPSPSRL